MALVIEDGTIVAGATSFATRAEIISYAAARGYTIANVDASDVYAILAMDFIRTLDYAGDLVDDEQELPFPRSGLVEGDTEDGYVFTIPTGMKRAQMQLALDASNGITLTASSNPSALVKRVKVGAIEREYFDPASQLTLDGSPPLTVAMALLAPFLVNGGGVAISALRV